MTDKEQELDKSTNVMVEDDFSRPEMQEARAFLRERFHRVVTGVVEYEALVTQLDQLNSALDFLESMADNVHAEVVELLKSNRETKEQFQESKKDESAEKSK